MVGILAANPDPEDLALWVRGFLRPRPLSRKVDHRVTGNATMTGGTPEGSPLSPSLYTIYMSAMVDR